MRTLAQKLGPAATPSNAQSFSRHEAVVSLERRREGARVEGHSADPISESSLPAPRGFLDSSVPASENFAQIPTLSRWTAPVQRKSLVREAGDSYEREADEV